MKKLIIAILVLGTCRLWADVTNSETIVERETLLASLKSLFLSPKALEYEENQITLYPERSQLSQYGERNRLTWTYSLQEDRTAPLLIIIPGAGGFANSQSLLFFSEMAFRQGYSVITIPSTTHWSFALAASSDGRIGFLPKDGRDNYRLLLTLKYKLQREMGLQPRQVGILGISYGGLDGKMLVREDARQKAFGFDFLVMINTPLDLQNALNRIDSYYSIGINWPERRKFNLRSFAQGRMIEISKGMVPFSTTYEVEKALPISTQSLIWLTGATFRDALFESVRVAEAVSGQLGLTDSYRSKGIMEYLKDEVYKPLARKQNRSLESMLEDQEQLALQSHQHSQETFKGKVILFYSEDDFLSFPEGNGVLQKLPYELHRSSMGGHLGNIAIPAIQRDLGRTLLRLKR